MIVDVDANKLTRQTRSIKELAKQLDGSWPPHRLTEGEKSRIIEAVASIVGHRRLTAQPREIEDLRNQLAGLWPPHQLTEDEKSRVMSVVTSIIGRDRPKEAGLAAYQHPIRMNPRRSNSRTRPVEVSPFLDTYSALVILTALRALAADLSLLERYMTRPENDNLLFTPNDHAQPKQSSLFDELSKSKDPAVVEYAGRLREWAASPVGKYLGIESLVRDPFSPLRDAIAQKDWEAVVRIAAGKPVAAKPLPPTFQDAVKSAREKLDALKRLRDASVTKQARPIVQALQATRPLLADWPAAQVVLAEAETFVPIVARLDELKAAAGKPALKAVWAKHRNSVPDSPETRTYKAECDLREAADARDWARLVPMGYTNLPPFVVPTDLAPVVAQATRMGTARDTLARAVNAKDQVATADALKNATVLADWRDCGPLLAAARQLVADAQKRAEGTSALKELEKVAGTRALLASWKRIEAKVATVEGAARFRAEVELWQAADAKDWDRIASQTQRAEAKFPVPDSLLATVEKARKKVGLRDRLKLALDSGQVRQISRAADRNRFRPGRLAGLHPAARQSTPGSREAPAP